MTQSARRRISESRISPAWGLIALPWLWFLVRSLHPVADLAAAILPWAICGALFLAAGMVWHFHSWPFAGLVVSLLLFFVVAVYGPTRSQSRPEPLGGFRVAAMNVGLYWYSNNDAGYFVDQVAPDLLVGVEFSESHDQEMRTHFTNAISDVISLEQQRENERNPEQAKSAAYKANGLPSVGLYTNFAVERLDDPIADQIEGGLPGIRARIETDDGPVIVYALHVPRPGVGSVLYDASPTMHQQMVDAIVRSAESETLPVVILGDLNSVDRGQSYRMWSGSFVDGMRSNISSAPTADRPFPWSLLRLRLDHIFMTDDLCATDQAVEDTRYSDHKPISAIVGPC